MTEHVVFRKGEPADDSALKEMLRENAMPGSISLSMRYEPSLFQAIDVERGKTHVAVCEDAGRIVGMGVISEREVFLHGKPCRAGYLSRLRVKSTHRSSTVLARGYRYFKAIHNDEFNVPFYLSTILESNRHAVGMLTSGRGDLPVYRDIGGYISLVFPVVHHRRPAFRGSRIQVINGVEAGAELVVRCLHRYGKDKPFFPVYREEDITGEGRELQGLFLSDFALAMDGDEAIGVMACRDRRRFQQIHVNSYSGAVRFARKPLNFLCGLAGYPPLPDLGETVSAMYCTGVAIRNDETEVFGKLLSHVLADASERGANFLVAGFSEKDPLLKRAAGRLHLEIRSRIYAVSWNGAQPLAADEIPYLDPGSL